MPKYLKYFYPKNVKIPGTRLTPVGLAKRNGKTVYRCICDCGEEVFPASSEIKTRTFSCGCLGIEKRSKVHTTHGLSKRPEYFASHHAFSRCYDPSSRDYKDYGGRGIRCEFETATEMTEWLVKNLPKPSPKSVLDRRNKGGNYSRTNLRWVTQAASNRNKRTNRMIEIGGISKPLCDWAEETGIGKMTITCRIKRGTPKSLWLYKGHISAEMMWEHKSAALSAALKQQEGIPYNPKNYQGKATWEQPSLT
jgi:hypothetical protein